MKKIHFILFLIIVSANHLYAQIENGVIYKIKNVNSGRYAQTGYASKDNGASINLYDNSNDAHFKWRAVETAPGSYKFQNINSGKFLAVMGAVKTTMPLFASGRIKNSRTLYGR